MTPIADLARYSIQKLSPYESARSLATQGSVFLDANEFPDSIVEGSSLNRYPDPQPKDLLDRFSHLYTVHPSTLLVGRGSDEAIDLVVRTFCESGKDQILICPPTYGMYEVSAQIQGAGIIRVPLQAIEDTFALDVREILNRINQEPDLKVIFLCSPNNPTGTELDRTSLLRICESARNRCIVVIDEAYIEFSSDGSISQFLSDYPHLIILRTLSKAWGLAGIRCGVAISSPEVIQLLNKIRAPYPLNTPGIKTVLEATAPSQEDRLKNRILKLKQDREELVTQILRLSVVKHIYPSETNFLLVKFNDSERIFYELKSKGILVRNRSKEQGLEGCIRITVGTREQNQNLVSRLSEVLS